MNTVPKVSVVSICYNQEDYIRETLDGFVMQKTDFPFEVVIADDCSTDKTPEIIKEYAEAHPDIFKPILRKKNLGVLRNFSGAIQAAQGTYIALCEGDDYWTDPQKLQMQADFLDKNPAYALCFHPVKVFWENGEEKDVIYPDSKDKSQFTVKELLQHNFIQTNSVMYRKQKYDDIPLDVMPLDIYLHLYHAQFGKIGFIDKVMSSYRRHAGGIWWDAYKDEDEIWKKHALAHLALFIALGKLYGDKAEYKVIIDTAIDNMFNKLTKLDNKYSKNFLEQATRNYPEETAELIARQHQQMLTTMKESQKKDQEIHNLRAANSDMEQQIIQKDHVINAIHSSRVWKARNKVARLRGHEKV
jgi:glycosyltransferase involved in cell wall biosynthesis